MTKAFHAVDRAFQTETLSTSYNSDAIVIPVGAIGASITLDDSSIGFTVQDQAAGTPEEAVPAGSSYVRDAHQRWWRRRGLDPNDHSAQRRYAGHELCRDGSARGG